MCSGRLRFDPAEISPLASLRVPELDSCSTVKRRMLTGVRAGLEGCWVPQVHLPCAHNALDALVRRSLGPVPAATDINPLRVSFRKLRRICRRYDGDEWTLERTAMSYSGSLQRRYLEAARSLSEDPLSPEDWKLKCFVKAEKLDVRAKASKPRLIFPRSPRYNLALAAFLKPFEHWLWGVLKGVAQRGVRRSRVVGKGLNPERRANLIRRKMSEFADPLVMEVDGKAFEAHISADMVKLEHSCYLAAFRGSKDLAYLLGKQRTAGNAPGGIKFSRPGGRASGDFNTGMGNSLIMAAVVDCAMGIIGCKYDSLIDGDNALLFVERSDMPRVVADFPPLAQDHGGQEMVLEKPTGVFEEVVFGQSHPIDTGYRLGMVRDWKKVLSGATSSHNHMHHYGEVHRFLLGVAICEYSLARGVPVLGDYFYQLQADCRKVASTPLGESHYRDYQAMGVNVREVLGKTPVWVEPTMVARVSFERAFGVSPREQVLLEGRLPRISFSSLPPVLVGLDHHSIDNEPFVIHW